MWFAVNKTNVDKIEHTLHGASGWILEASQDIPGLPKDLWKPNLFHIVSFDGVLLNVSCSASSMPLLDCVSSAVDHGSLRITTSCNSRVAESVASIYLFA